MNNVFSYYTKYKEHTDEYSSWENSKKDENARTRSYTANLVQQSPAGSSQQSGYSSYNAMHAGDETLKQKAKTIAEPILLFDSYEHEKAEDSETFFQTLNIELMSITGAICSFPIALTKIIPFLNKHAEKNEIIKKSANLLTKYKNSAFNIAGKSISAPKAATLTAAILGGIFYINRIKNSMESQLGLIRKASFDASQNIINDPKLFAILTPEQEKQVNSIVSYEEKNNNAIVDKLKDSVSLNSTFKSVNDYKSNKKEYEKNKAEYFESIKPPKNSGLSNEQVKKAMQDEVLFENLIKNVEHDVLEPLRKVETISNISYSALFTGGFLEYLISDKLVEVLGVKNKVISSAIKFGVPLLTYLLLNKNISNIENKAILATKYKHLKQFTENPGEYSNNKENEKQSLPDFIKTVLNDMKEYEKFSNEELPRIKEKMEAKKQIKLSPQQLQDAKQLQKNTSMVLNTQREKVYEQSVGIKALSETILGPIDILATAIGAKIGSSLAKKCPNKKISGLLTGLGAVIAFIPAAIIEAKLTKQQKLSEKIAAMLSIKEMQDYSKFADYTNNKSLELTGIPKSEMFKEFIT